MKLGKLLIALTTATVLLGALVGSAFARNFSVSSQSERASFTSLEFRGGFGTVRCEVVLEGTLHSRTSTKTVGSLIGYLTAGTVTRCASGGATIDQSSLPWHRRYTGFTGTLPNIASVTETVSGASWRVREPTFGITCQVTVANITKIWFISISRIRTITVDGTAPCSGISGTLSGSTDNVDNRAGAAVTVTLI